MTTIVWFRQDLRASDNPALVQAAADGPVVPVYVFDSDEDGVRPIGGASRWWLHHSLAALKKALGGLVIMKGDALDCLRRLASETGAASVVWNRCYDPASIARDKAVKTALREGGLEANSFPGNLLHEPWEVSTGSGGPYKVFTPYWRAAQTLKVEMPVPAPKKLDVAGGGAGIDFNDLGLLPKNPDWAAGWDEFWQPGEAGAQGRLEDFLEDGLKGYGELRDRPDLAHVSRLSPHLHFGEISPRQVRARVRHLADSDASFERDAEKFLSEIGWREFSHHLLYHFPALPERNWRESFDAYPWRDSAEDLAAWQRGMTGYPLVDAGLRELWQTGFMHNRVRMVAASFLIKHLRLHWKEGEAWFWDTLADADLANNSAGWQWVAGSGADAAPYFRIFNPMTQGQKFDPDGAYVRRWCPELAKLDDRFIHAPFEAPAEALEKAGVVLGKTYPAPIVDHKKARVEALAGYEAVKAAG